MAPPPRGPGTAHLYTIIQIWSVWGCFLGCVGTAAGGALMMDCLPSDAEVGTDNCTSSSM